MPRAKKAPVFCVFCEIATGRIPSHKVWENREFIAFLDIRPVRPGHLLLVPKKHYESVFVLPGTLYARTFLVARALASGMERHFRVPRVGLIVEGFGVPHAHVHLIPISREGQLNPSLAKGSSPAALRRTRAGLGRALAGKT
jgi:histidine triad (HIT) family protein